MVQADSLAKVLVICGPTASGKTALAVECAKLLGSEVISADSMCVYKRCNVGTAKPTEEEMGGVVHHMIDVVEPTETYSVGDYRETALPILEGLIGRGKIPVICGGTGFYIDSLLYDLSYGNTAANKEIREKYERILAECGRERLHAILAERDAETAAVLHVNDAKRVIRALEILDVSGRKKSEMADERTPKYDHRSFSVDFSREELYERINERVDKMMKNGLVDEVKSLLNSGVSPSFQCMNGIGYKEVCQGIDEGFSENEIAELIKFNTRHYAKRQITFFKRDERMEYLKKDSAENLAREIIGKLR